MLFLSAVIGGLLFCSTQFLFGQHQEFEIQKITPKFVSIPQYHYTGGISVESDSTSNASFLSLEVEFSYRPQLENEETHYADNLLFTYYLFLNTRTQNYPQGILLVGSVTHTAIRARAEKYSVMYVAPSTISRFFPDRVPSMISQIIYDVGVTISKNGQTFSFKSWKGAGEWWKNYPKISGWLLNKNESPFAPLLWENYEQINFSNNTGYL